MTQLKNLDDLSVSAESAYGSDDMARLILRAQEHHQHARDQLQLIIDMKDKGLQLGGDDEDAVTIEAGSSLHRGVLIGVQMALHLLGEFPLKLVERD